MARRLRIGIDTLFENPLKPSGATGYLRTLLRWLPVVGKEHRFCAFVSRRNIGLLEGTSGLERACAGASNEHLLLRILSQQTVEAAQASLRRLDVFNAPGNVGPLLALVPLVVTIKTLHHYQAPAALGLARSVFRRVMFVASARRARLIIANGAATKAEIVQLMKVPASRVRIVYEAVHEGFSPDPDGAGVRARVRARFGLGEPYLLFVSSLWRYKNPDGLIRSYAALPAEQRRRVILGIVGQDYDGFRRELETLAGDLGVRDRVRFLGAVPNLDLPDLYRGAEMLIYPSHAETFGMPLVEAMRAGTPVVSSDVPALREVAADAALLVDSHDVRGLAQAVGRVLCEPDLRRGLVERGLRRGEVFTGERMARDTLAVYEEAAESR